MTGKTKKTKSKFLNALMLAVILFGILITPFAAKRFSANAQLGSPENDSQLAETQLVRSLQQTTDKFGPDDWTCGTLDVACGLLKAVNYVLDAISERFFNAGKIFLTSMIGYNLGAFEQSGGNNPMRVVYDTTRFGWSVVLAVANIFFILALLWIAIATIFDIGTFSARTTLPKFIIAALLINFSFPIGTAIIRLGNGIGQVFMKAIDDRGGLDNVSEMMFDHRKVILAIVSRTTTTKAEAEKILNKQQFAFPAFFGLAERSVTADTCHNVLSNHRERILGAVVWDNIVAAKGASAYFFSRCQELVANEEIANAIATVYPQDVAYRLLAMSTAAKIFLVPIGIFTIFAAGIFLLIRLISLLFLLVFAPFAFFSLAFPGLGDFWSKWWRKLFEWSFYLPAFLFLFLLSILFIQGIGPFAGSTITPDRKYVNDFGLLITYIIGIGLMIASLVVAKFMGIEGAAKIVGLGSKLAGGLGKFAGRKFGHAALGITAPWAKGLEEGETTARTKAARFMAKTLMKVPGVRRGLQKVTAMEKQRAGEYENQFDKFSSKELKRRHNMATTSQAARAAIINALAKRRDLMPEEDEKGYWDIGKIGQTIKYLRSIGQDAIPLERAAPHLAETTATDRVQGITGKERVIRGMRAEHIERMDPDAMNDPETLLLMAEYWKSGLYSKMMSFSPNVMARKFQEAANGETDIFGKTPEAAEQAKELGQKMRAEIEKDSGTKDYFASSPAMGHGYSIKGISKTKEEAKAERKQEEVAMEEEKEVARERARRRMEEEQRRRGGGGTASPPTGGAPPPGPTPITPSPTPQPSSGGSGAGGGATPGNPAPTPPPSASTPLASPPTMPPPPPAGGRPGFQTGFAAPPTTPPPTGGGAPPAGSAPGPASTPPPSPSSPPPPASTP